MARRIGVALVMVTVVGLCVWAGVYHVMARQAAIKLQRENQVTLTKTGDSLSDNKAPGAQGASLVGKPAPAFTLTDLSGKKVSLAQFKGHPVVVNFWATWCGPCKLEMPWFEALSAKYKDQGLVVLGLSQDEGAQRDEIATAVKKIGVSYRILMPDTETAKAYGGVDYLPETFYVSAKGDVVVANPGAPSKDEIEANIQKTIAKGSE